MRSRHQNSRRNRSLKVESLETRELMSANPVVNLQNRTLNIYGTSNAEQVAVSVNRNHHGGQLSYEVRINNRFSGAFPVNAVQNIYAALGNGNDSFSLSSPIAANRVSFGTLTVDLGAGRNESAVVRGVNPSRVQIQASVSTDTRVEIGDTRIADSVSLRLGSGRDTVSLSSGYIGRVDALLGSGDDSFYLNSQVTVHNMSMNMGAGNDRIISHSSAVVSSGSVDGGAGTDEFVHGRRNRPNFRAGLFGFERS